jgi:hypothetical protein
MANQAKHSMGVLLRYQTIGFNESVQILKGLETANIK